MKKKKTQLKKKLVTSHQGLATSKLKGEKKGKKIKKEKSQEIAISVKNLAKTFRVPHQKIDSVRGAFVNLLRNPHKGSLL